jgi:hypothetical protein
LNCSHATHHRVLVGHTIKDRSFAGKSAYGAYAVQNMDKKEAGTNADSYAKFAEEAWFSQRCGRSFGPALPPGHDEMRFDSARGKVTNNAD